MDNRDPLDCTKTAAERRAFGDKLRELRTGRRLSVEAVANATRIQARYILALESGELDKLPGEVFARGFVRNFAKAVHAEADQDALVADFGRAWKGVAEAVAPTEIEPEALKKHVQKVPSGDRRHKGRDKSGAGHIKGIVTYLAGLALIAVTALTVRYVVEHREAGGERVAAAPPAVAVAPVKAPRPVVAAKAQEMPETPRVPPVPAEPSAPVAASAPELQDEPDADTASEPAAPVKAVKAVKAFETAPPTLVETAAVAPPKPEPAKAPPAPVKPEPVPVVVAVEPVTAQPTPAPAAEENAKPAAVVAESAPAAEENAKPAAVVAESAPASAEAKPEASVPVPAGAQSLEITVTRAVRVRVALDSGQSETKELKPDTYKLTFSDQANLLIYDAAALSISYNGRTLGDLGGKGRIRRLSFRAQKPEGAAPF